MDYNSGVLCETPGMEVAAGVWWRCQGLANAHTMHPPHVRACRCSGHALYCTPMETAIGTTALPEVKMLRVGMVQWSPRAIIITLSACAGIAFAVAGVLHHRAYHSAAEDLAFYDQILWNTAHGHPFVTSFISYNYLGQHMQPALLPFALLYRIWAAPELLLVAGGLIAAVAVLPLYGVARRLLHHDGAAAVVAGLYLLSPYLHHATNFDFHPEQFAPLLVFLGYGYVLDGRPRAAFAAFAPVLLCKEDTVILLIGVAWLCWLHRERRLALALAVTSLLWGSLITLVVMPHFRRGPSDLEMRYGYLGRGVGGILVGLIVHPGRALGHLWIPAIGVTVLALVASVGLLPLLAPRQSLAAVPLLLFHLLSTHAPQMLLHYHYSLELLPLVWIAALHGLVRAQTWVNHRTLGAGRRAEMQSLLRYFHLTPNALGVVSRPGQPARIVLGWLALCGIVAFAIASPFPPARLFMPGRFVDDPAHARAVATALALIPPDAAVSAQTGLAPHLSHRQQLAQFPTLDGAQYVLLDASDDVARTEPKTQAASVFALPAQGYTLIYSSDGVAVYAKNSR